LSVRSSPHADEAPPLERRVALAGSVLAGAIAVVPKIVRDGVVVPLGPAGEDAA
jgi:hypothetical protein